MEDVVSMAQQMSPAELEQLMRQLSSVQQGNQLGSNKRPALVSATAADQVGARIQEMMGALEEVVRVATAVPTNGEEAKFMIDSTFGDMAALLEMRRAELIEAVCLSCNDRHTVLEQQRAEMELQIRELRDFQTAMASSTSDRRLSANFDRLMSTHLPNPPRAADGICVDLEAATQMAGMLKHLNVALIEPPTDHRADHDLREEPAQQHAALNGFDPRLCHADITLRDRNTRLVMAGNKRWATALGPRLMPGSQHFWWVRLGQCANVMVGVAVDSCMLLDTHAEQRAWFYYCSTGHKYQAGQSSAYGGKCEAGDVVGVFYDADAHTISFYKNALCLGPAFSGLPPNMRPAVSLHNLNSEVTVDFGSYDAATAAFVGEASERVTIKPGRTPRMVKMQRQAGKKHAAKAAREHPEKPTYSFKPQINDSYFEGTEVKSRLYRPKRAPEATAHEREQQNLRKAWS